MTTLKEVRKPKKTVKKKIHPGVPVKISFSFETVIDSDLLYEDRVTPDPISNHLIIEHLLKCGGQYIGSIDDTDEHTIFSMLVGEWGMFINDDDKVGMNVEILEGRG